MKKKVAVLAAAMALTLSLGAFAGCTPKVAASSNSDSSQATQEVVADAAAETEAEAEEAAAVLDGIPANMPADHQGRFESMGGSGCSACHATTDGKTTAGGGAMIPEDHYVDGSYATGEIDAVRMQCNTCHAQEA